MNVDEGDGVVYKYEMHLHTKEGSECSSSSARELARVYYNAGYAGIVITNHFVQGSTCVPRDLPWQEKIKRYYAAYLEAKEECQELDFDVFFGFEYAYGDGKEILAYGIDLEFLENHPELNQAGLETYASLVREAGGIIIHAHPHRARAYVKPGVLPRYDVCDGIEVYNAADEAEWNKRAEVDAKRYDMIRSSGGDVHHVTDRTIGMAGICFEKRIRTNEELVAALRQRKGKLIIAGEIK